MVDLFRLGVGALVIGSLAVALVALAVLVEAELDQRLAELSVATAPEPSAEETARSLETFLRRLSPDPGGVRLSCRIHLPRDGGSPQITLRTYDQTREFECVVTGNAILPR